MTPKLLQLYSLRAQVEALIAMEEADFAREQPAPETGCQHPEDKRVSLTTFGTEPSFKCMVCGEKVQGVA